MCGGSGQINADSLTYTGPSQEEKDAARLENETKKAWLLAATSKQIAALGFKQLLKARDFASACLSCGDNTVASVHRMIMKRIEEVV